MAAMETLLAGKTEWSVVATGTNTTVTATKASTGQAGTKHYVWGLSMSADGAPGSGLTAKLQKDSQTVTLDAWQIPAAMFAPLVLNYLHAFEGTDNGAGAGFGDVSLTIPALGAGVTAVAVIKGTTR